MHQPISTHVFQPIIIHVLTSDYLPAFSAKFKGRHIRIISRVTDTEHNLESVNMFVIEFEDGKRMYVLENEIELLGAPFSK